MSEGINKTDMSPESTGALKPDQSEVRYHCNTCNAVMHKKLVDGTDDQDIISETECADCVSVYNDEAETMSDQDAQTPNAEYIHKHMPSAELLMAISEDTSLRRIPVNQVVQADRLQHLRRLFDELPSMPEGYRLLKCSVSIGFYDAYSGDSMFGYPTRDRGYIGISEDVITGIEQAFGTRMRSLELEVTFPSDGAMTFDHDPKYVIAHFTDESGERHYMQGGLESSAELFFNESSAGRVRLDSVVTDIVIDEVPEVVADLLQLATSN